MLQQRSRRMCAKAPSLSYHKCLFILAFILGIIATVNATGQHNVASNITDESLVWGPYRPNVYFGVRSKHPQSIFTGIIWTKVQDFRTIQNSFRHTCEQNEGMAGYGWEEYDVRSGGRQVIHDTENDLDITTQFAKVPGGEHGGNWGVRVRGTLRKGAPKDTVSTIVFYIGVEATGEGRSVLELLNAYHAKGYDDQVRFAGATENLGDFGIEVTRGPSSNKYPGNQHPVFKERPTDRTMVQSVNIPEEALWQAKTVMFQLMKTTVDEYGERFDDTNSPPPWQVFTIGTSQPIPANMHLVQKVFKGSFEFDILFSSASTPSRMTSQLLTEKIKESSQTFSARFKEAFKTTGKFADEAYEVFSKSLLSNLLGGIGYFKGDQVVDRSYASEYEEENEGFWVEAAEARARNAPKLEGPYELFSLVPSRPFFPRGFLWDEGFHLLPVLDYDAQLGLEIIESWFSLIDDDGWIAREQILGLEARSKVPPEFQIQYPHYANPPTLFLALQKLVKRLKNTDVDGSENMNSRLLALYPLLQRNYEWYRQTQRGDLKSYDREASSSREGYRWRGRTPSHILTSGLDDYPRALPPHPGELHVDLLSWIGMMTKSLQSIASHLNETDDAIGYAKTAEAITRNIDDLHWSEEDRTYCDATIDDFEENKLVCHKGYISLFPFMTGLLSVDHPHLGAVLDLLADPEELWSPHGIRSLSKKDPFYGTNENYWRSPVWINMNFLILDNLLVVAQSKGPEQVRAKKLYSSLRENVVQTVYKSWKATGFAWEQYNPDTGEGQRTQHFTGWTSLVVKMISMPELTDDSKHREL